jgi:hypothetical protein
MNGAGHNRLFALADDIRALHRAIGRNAEQVARDAIEAGQCLIEAKSLLQHGEWEAWLHDHATVSPRTARLYMQLARSGLESATVADLGLNAAVRRIAGPEQSSTAIASVRPMADLPLCLTRPPALGQAFSFVVGLPHRWVVIWESSQHPGFYHVVVFDTVDDIVETGRRPIFWIGISSWLRHLHIYLDDKSQVERRPCDARLWESVQRHIARQNEPGWREREWEAERQASDDTDGHDGAELEGGAS